MSILITFLHRYLSPFMAGGCIAGATVAGEIPIVVILVLTGATFGYASLPAGGRMIRRIVGAPS